jgi:hypothetical protein
MAGEGFVEVAPPPLSMYRTYIQYDVPLLQILIVASQIVGQRRNKARTFEHSAPSLGSVQAAPSQPTPPGSPPRAECIPKPEDRSSRAALAAGLVLPVCGCLP